jgi:hypothetical protein
MGGWVNRWGRLPVWKLMTIVALLALPMAFCLVPIGRQAEWGRVHRQMDDTIRYLKPSDPSGVDPAVWDHALGATITAYGNVCFSTEHVSIPEMYRLRDDLDAKLKGKVDLDTLVWIWERLGETGPPGQSYARRHRPLLDQYLPARP